MLEMKITFLILFASVMLVLPTGSFGGVNVKFMLTGLALWMFVINAIRDGISSDLVILILCVFLFFAAYYFLGVANDFEWASAVSQIAGFSSVGAVALVVIHFCR